MAGHRFSGRKDGSYHPCIIWFLASARPGYSVKLIKIPCDDAKGVNQGSGVKKTRSGDRWQFKSRDVALHSWVVCPTRVRPCRHSTMDNFVGTPIQNSIWKAAYLNKCYCIVV